MSDNTQAGSNLRAHDRAHEGLSTPEGVENGLSAQRGVLAVPVNCAGRSAAQPLPSQSGRDPAAAQLAGVAQRGGVRLLLYRLRRSSAATAEGARQRRLVRFASGSSGRPKGVARTFCGG